MHEVEKFFCQFPNPWTLRVSGMGGYTSKCEKKSKSLHPNAQATGEAFGPQKSTSSIQKFLYFLIFLPSWMQFWIQQIKLQ